MKILFSLFALFVFSSLYSDEFSDKFGNGVIQIQPDSLKVLELYSKPGVVSHRIEFFQGPAIYGQRKMRFDNLAEDSLPAWFHTLYFLTGAEYSRIDIVGVDSTDGYYRTLLIDEDGSPVLIKKKSEVRFMSWFGFYCSVASIQPLSESLILYESPSEKSRMTNYTQAAEGSMNSMRPLEVNAHWMRVELQIITEPGRPALIYTGWIRWRNDKEPLIRHNLMGC